MAIIFETLGERTLALGQVARQADPEKGYEPLLEQFLAPILAPALAAGITIVGNFGAANPPAAARAIARLAGTHGLSPRIAVISGDDMLGHLFDESKLWEGDAGLPTPKAAPIAVNVYLGARRIADAIRAGAQIVVAGRMADPALALGPLVAHFGWDWDDWDRSRRARCRASSGMRQPGLAAAFSRIPASRTCRTWPGSAFHRRGYSRRRGGDDEAPRRPAADRPRHRERAAVYEIHDPAAYMTPDVTLDVSGVCLEQLARTASASPAPAAVLRRTG